MSRRTLPRAPRRALWLAAALLLVALAAATCGRSRAGQEQGVADSPAVPPIEAGAAAVAGEPTPLATAAAEAEEAAGQPAPAGPEQSHAFPTATPTLPAAPDTAQNAVSASPLAAAAARTGLIGHVALAPAATPTTLPAPPARKPGAARVRLPESGALAAAPAIPAAPAVRAVAAKPAPPTPTALPPAVPDRLVLPALDLDTPVVELGWNTQTSRGGDLFSEWEVAEYAAGWHKNSALPGQGGNIVFSGHNNILGAVFRELDRLQRGDTALLYVGDKAYEYAIDKVMIVPEKHATAEQRTVNAAWIGPTDEERLTLVSCWPRDDNTHRIIVVAHPVAVASEK